MPCSLSKLRRLLLLLLLSGVSLNFLQVCSSCSKGKKEKERRTGLHFLLPPIESQASSARRPASLELQPIETKEGERSVHRGVNSINHKVCASDAISL